MSTNLVVEMVGSGSLDRKISAEREYEVARSRVDQARQELAVAQNALVVARAERRDARNAYEEDARARRKPRQTNIVRRILSQIAESSATRKEIVDETGLDPTTVSSTLTRLRHAGFVERDGSDFAGKWKTTTEGMSFLNSDAPFPKEYRT
jgi:predicted transcriptional regulator